MAVVQEEDETAVLTPRLEKGPFSSALDGNAILTTSADSVQVCGHLTNVDGDTSDDFQLETCSGPDFVQFRANGEGMTFVLPLVSPLGEAVHRGERRVEISKAQARVICEASSAIRIIEGETARVFHFVPGVQAVRLEIMVPAGGQK